MAANGNIVDWYGWAASVPILGTLIALIFRNRAKLSAEILRLQKELDEHRLEVAKGYASNSYIQEVEKRLTARIEAMEKNILAQIAGGT